MNITFHDQLAVVTGATGGIGYVCAKTLLESGAKVALVDINQEALDRVAGELSEFGTVQGFALNLAEVDSIAPVVTKIREAMGCLLYTSSSHVSKFFAFRIVKPGDRPILIIFAIQIFTVVSQVALMSILGVFERFGATSQFVPNYIYNYCLNFLMALPAQLFISGPIARALFRRIFRRERKTATPLKVSNT